MEGTWGAVYIHFKSERIRRVTPNDNTDHKADIKKVRSIGPGVVSSMDSSKSGQSLHRLASEQNLSSSSTMGVETTTTTINAATVVLGDYAIYVTTKDAHTLTDGPTIFLAQDVQKIAKFCIQQANIPERVMKDIMDKIEFNNKVNEKILETEQTLEDEVEKTQNKQDSSSETFGGKKAGKNAAPSSDDKIGKSKDKKIIQLQDQLEMYRSMIKNASLHEIFVPNKLAHIKKWAEFVSTDATTAYTSDIDDETVVSIMMLPDVDNTWKILLLLGIGVFANHESIAYTEIMKKLADQQRLYMIIADSDYIYGTNYQFCHGYLSKDMNLTQEKIIQAMGRIGRNNIQQEYSVRFRDDEQVNILFKTYDVSEKPEVVNMNKLLSSRE